MTLLIKKSGILTTVQDLGRTRFRRFGINPNGVMDNAATRAVNILLGNDENDAVLEMHFPTGEFEFDRACGFAIGGADLGAELDSVRITNWSTHTARKGSILRFTERVFGSRAYLAVCGGFEIDRWLGSACTNLTAGCGGPEGRPVRKGDRLAFGDFPTNVSPRQLSRSIVPMYNRFPTVRIIAGPEFDSLTAGSQTQLCDQGYSISNNSNRMGYRLSGGPLERNAVGEMISSAVTFGTMQLLPDGQLIVLMADHQTTGGYPRIANVIAADLPLLAQIGPGDGVGFHLVDHTEAEELYFDMERDFNLLKVGCMFG